MTTSLSNATEASAPSGFAALNLSEPVLKAIEEVGYTEPTPVQAATYPVAITGRDIIVQARTGTGKTAAFGIPLVDKLVGPDPWVQALVLAPTRELAVQSQRELARLAQFKGLHTVAIYGGAPMGRQIDELKSGAQLVSGTPGRVLDHLRRGTFDPSHLKVLVLDEMDEMLSMGFAKELNAILELIPPRGRRQTMCFSATVDGEVRRHAERHMHEPEMISLSSDAVAAEQITHQVYMVSGRDRIGDLVRVLEVDDPESAIIFCNMRSETERVAMGLKQAGFNADWLNGDLPQRDRERIMASTREGKLRYLVATDVAARGIDISHLTHVINFTFPESAAVYVHRTGRTGRAGRTGCAISLVGPEELGRLYYLRLEYKISPVERSLPTHGELKTRAEIDRIGLLEDAFKDRANPTDLSIARRLLTHPENERILAGLLHTFFGHKEDVDEEAAAARRSKLGPDLEQAARPARERERHGGRERGRDRDDRSRPRDRDRDARGRDRDREARSADGESRDRDRSRDRNRDRSREPREGDREARESDRPARESDRPARDGDRDRSREPRDRDRSPREGDREARHRNRDARDRDRNREPRTGDSEAREGERQARDGDREPRDRDRSREPRESDREARDRKREPHTGDSEARDGDGDRSRDARAGDSEARDGDRQARDGDRGPRDRDRSRDRNREPRDRNRDRQSEARDRDATRDVDATRDRDSEFGDQGASQLGESRDRDAELGGEAAARQGEGRQRDAARGRDRGRERNAGRDARGRARDNAQERSGVDAARGEGRAAGDVESAAERSAYEAADAYDGDAARDEDRAARDAARRAGQGDIAGSGNEAARAGQSDDEGAARSARVRGERGDRSQNDSEREARERSGGDGGRGRAREAGDRREAGSRERRRERDSTAREDAGRADAGSTAEGEESPRSKSRASRAADAEPSEATLDGEAAPDAEDQGTGQHARPERSSRRRRRGRSRERSSERPADADDAQPSAAEGLTAANGTATDDEASERRGSSSSRTRSRNSAHATPLVAVDGELLPTESNGAESAQLQWDEADAPASTELLEGLLYLNLGKRDGLRVPDVARLLRDSCELSRGQIGRIRVRDRYTFVDVPEERLDSIIATLSGQVVHDKPLAPERAKTAKN